MWWGRVAGALIGIPGGLFGIVFGFLIGFLLDRILTDLLFRRRVERFVTAGHDEEHAPPEAKAISVVGLATYVAGADGAVTLSQTGRIHDFVRRRRVRDRSRWEERFPVLTRLQNPDAGIHRLMDECARLSSRLRPDRLAEVYRSASDSHERRELAGLLVRLARRGSIRMSRAGYERLTQTVELLGLSQQELEDLMANTRDLDAKSCRILGVSRSAGPKEVKRGYRRLVAQFHPDRNAVLSEAQRRETEEAFLRIQDAYNTLMEQLNDAQRRI